MAAGRPEIDVLEGRGQRPGDLVMTTHWRIPTTQKIKSCGFDFLLPDASMRRSTITECCGPRTALIYFIDRKPVSEIKVPVGYEDPMYMIVNLAIGSKWFGGVGVVDGASPQWSNSKSTGFPPIKSIRDIHRALFAGYI